jgi:hypothetical protein
VDLARSVVLLMVVPLELVEAKVAYAIRYNFLVVSGVGAERKEMWMWRFVRARGHARGARYMSSKFSGSIPRPARVSQSSVLSFPSQDTMA